MCQIYQPAEDSYLLAECLKNEIKKLSKDKNKLKKIKFFDMGCGMGIQAKTALECGISKKNIFCVDINNNAVKFVRKKGFTALKSNLFSKIKKNKQNKFNLIAFDPPYLPENKYDKKKDTTGGKKGCETILRFLKQVKNYLNKEGFILLLLSSFTPFEKIKKQLLKEKMKYKQIKEKKLFFERLFVWRIENK